MITTDAVADGATLQNVLRDAARRSFERIDSDGCLSTNDTVLLLASGASGIAADPADLAVAVEQVCQSLAAQLIADAEGATKEITIDVAGAADEDDAVEVGRAIARNNLLKCALFGNDPNWGRVLAAIGTTRAAFDPDQLDVAINGVQVCRTGAAGDDRSGVDLSGRRRPHRGRPARRRRGGHGADQRPLARVRRRELGVLDMRTVAQAMDKAATLVDALPWLARFHDKIIVVKLGGNAMISPELQAAFAEDVMFLRYAGLKPVIVHGGGPQITEHLNRLGIESEFRGGLRVTTPEMVSIVRMVLDRPRQRRDREPAQRPRVVRHRAVRRGRQPAHRRASAGDRRRRGGRHRPGRRRGRRRSVGDAGAHRRRPDPGDRHRGPRPRRAHLQRQRRHRRGRDRRRPERREADRADRRRGPLRRLAGQHRGRQRDRDRRTAALLPGLAAGMVPKMEACLRAVEGGVPRAHVLDGRVPHALLLEIFTSEGVGTMVVPDKEQP